MASQYALAGARMRFVPRQLAVKGRAIKHVIVCCSIIHPHGTDHRPGAGDCRQCEHRSTTGAANVPPSCSTSPLYTNGTFVTAPGLSAVTAPDIGFGFLAEPTGSTVNSNNPPAPGEATRARLADDFVVGGNGWRPSAITLYGYQIDSGTTSTITGVVGLRLWDGIPGAGGSVIAGPVNGTITQNAFTGVYRVRSDDQISTSRPIHGGDD
jgi:hypothetical protein